MKAVIPAAGHGTRFLPLTKGQPKEMLPVVDKPTIQYVVEEAIAAGVDDIIIITGRDKRAIEDHFDRSSELEHFLKEHGKERELKQVQEISSLAEIHYVRQKTPRGLGDAIYCARKHVGDEPFAVMLGDTIHVSEVPVVKQLMDVQHQVGGSVIAVEQVLREKIKDYGIIAGNRIRDRLYKVMDLVEKPQPDAAPSNIAIAGTYVLSPGIFECIERTKPGYNNEIQLTDALRLLMQKEDIHAWQFHGKRYDVGDMLGWMKTNFELTLKSDAYGKQLKEFLTPLLNDSGGTCSFELPSEKPAIEK